MEFSACTISVCASTLLLFVKSTTSRTMCLAGIVVAALAEKSMEAAKGTRDGCMVTVKPDTSCVAPVFDCASYFPTNILIFARRFMRSLVRVDWDQECSAVPTIHASL